MVVGAFRRSSTVFQIQGTLEKVVGSYIQTQRSFSAHDTKRFAELTGDTNPLHTDEMVAKESKFGQPIVHGILCCSLFSMLLGSSIPGSIYVSQSFQFKAPVFLNEAVTARIQVSSIRSAVNVLVCRTTIIKPDGKIAIDGRAQVLLPKD